MIILQNTLSYMMISADFQGASTIPTDVAVTIQKPDIVAVNRSHNKVVLFKLSFPFELNIDIIDDTHYWKVEQYAKLISDIESNGYEGDVLPSRDKCQKVYL